jgi:hypothetical protein
MKLCKIGIHRFKTVGTQSANGVVGGFSEISLHREVLKCDCGKIKYIGFDIATNAHLDDSLVWKPNVL